ncbi:hypothetical protein [Aurantimicrobium sp. MWH-Uga1]|uniref:hypothetical protein n=1 Tax=Aurantimicrobium sp. MWH-Uga1 TaxID=2079575 RepID=UPI000DEE188B|nr:hypothetical protein [Aurantimicrobium sp. MWH-Uga1]AXE54086.1 hypothetical protein AURUGA1_00379 [Aurantimicrobium sp. MWH-Uga1]
MSLLDDLMLELPKGYSFTPVELTQIQLAQAQLDDVARLETVLESEGPIVIGHAGQTRLNAAFSELRQSRHEAARQIEVIRRGMLSVDKPVKAGTRYTASAARIRA